jgi:ABC-type multidrug transport system ATPase subunit
MTDDQLQLDVTAELSWDPKVDSTTIAASANHGTITLRGTVGSLREKREAKKAAERVYEVTTVDGRPPGRGNPEAGYVAQQRVFDRDLSIRGRDLVPFGVDGHRLGLPRTRSRQVASVIAAVGAQTYADAPIGLLSGGQQQQQRLRIAQALAGRPRLLPGSFRYSVAGRRKATLRSG